MSGSPVRSGSRSDLHALLAEGLDRLTAGELERARKCFRRALRRAPSSPDAHKLLGVTHCEMGRLGEAAEDFRRASALRPDFAEAIANLGQVLDRLGRFEAAAEAFTRVAALAPGLAETHVSLGNALEALGRHEEALEAYRRALSLEPNAAPLIVNAANMLAALGRHGEACARYERAVGLDPRFAVARYQLAVSRLAIGDTERALGAVEACVEIEPTHQEGLALLAVLLHELGREDEARVLYDFDALVGVFDLEPPDGYPDIEGFNAKLVGHLGSHPSLVPDPFGASTRGGRHSGELTEGEMPRMVRALHERVGETVRRYVDALPRRDDHPFLGRRPRDCRLCLQANILDPEGFLIPHVHPAGWVSGAYYPAVPAGVGESDPRRCGWLEFGRPHDAIVVSRPYPTHHVCPRPGRLVLFPSYFYHSTVPFDCEGTRFSVAVDWMPRG